MRDLKGRAGELLAEFKGDAYRYGVGCLEAVGEQAAQVAGRVVLVRPYSQSERADRLTDAVAGALKSAGVEIAGEPVRGARPNTPREDVYRLEGHLLHRQADGVVVIGGGSGIDAAKAASVLATYGGESAEIEDYFGVGKVTAAGERTGVKMPAIVAVETASASAAHLTKYSNVTDPAAGQKKLIVDEAIVPARAMFDYAVTTTMSRDFTYDGAIDGQSHILEVYCGAKAETIDKIEAIASVGIELVVTHLERALADPGDQRAREALGLGTDLGGYAIMTGGTNGAHLTSFSLVDVTTHGRACGIMNPYYTVFFAPAIERQLRVVGDILARAGYMESGHERLAGRELGEVVADGLRELAQRFGFPSTLSELDGFTRDHIGRALAAAKDPQLDMKLKAMPVPLSAGTVDDFMGPVLEAAACGDFSLIRNMPA